MKKITVWALFLFAIISGSNRIGQWESWTSPLIVHDLVALDGKIYSATEGGLLIYDLDEGGFRTVTNIDGLLGTNLNVISIDMYGNIWLGGAMPNGFVQIIDPINDESIHEFDFGLTEIIDIACSDTVAYAVYKKNQDIGLQKFLYTDGKWVHNDLMTTHWLLDAEFIEGIEIWGDRIFVGSEHGLYFGTINEDPSVWTIPLVELNGEITSLYLTGEELIVACDKIVYSLNLPTFELTILVDYMNWALHEVIKTVDGSLYGILSNKYFKLGEDAYEWYFQFPSHTVNKLLLSENGQVIAGTKSGLGFVDLEKQKFDYRIPNVPLTNQFSAVTVLNDGRVVAGSKYGLAIKEDWGWRNIVETTGTDPIIHSTFDPTMFAADTLPIDFGGFIADIEQGPDGLIYCAVRGTYPEPIRHGGGVVIIDIDNPANYTIVDTTKLDYWFTSDNSTPYLVVKDLEFDRDGNLWVADTYARYEHNPISVRTPSGQWNSYHADNGGILSITPNTLAIDSWNRVWVGSFEGEENTGENMPNGGLVMLDYSGSPAEPETYEWVNYSTGNSPSEVSLGFDDTGNNTVYSLAINQNRMWILTRVGLAYFDLGASNNRPIVRQGPKSTTQTLLTYFPNISFGLGSKLKLDARGNVWALSPSDGIHILLANGTYWPDEDPTVSVEGINVGSSLLLSDEVTDIDFDIILGVAYITTNRGISVLKIPFADPIENYSGISVYPSPFHIPSQKPLIVDGLTDESSLIVMTVTGKVIRHIKNSDLNENGYQIKWDGKNTQGEWVGSGVYLLSVYNPHGENSFSKITVIRH